jgi:hypothetical protein
MTNPTSTAIEKRATLAFLHRLFQKAGIAIFLDQDQQRLGI